MIDSPHWNWGTGQCEKHPAGGMPCHACIKVNDSALFDPNEVDRVVRVMNDTGFVTLVDTTLPGTQAEIERRIIPAHRRALVDKRALEEKLVQAAREQKHGELLQAHLQDSAGNTLGRFEVRLNDKLIFTGTNIIHKEFYNLRLGEPFDRQDDQQPVPRGHQGPEDTKDPGTPIAR